MRSTIYKRLRLLPVIVTENGKTCLLLFLVFLFQVNASFGQKLVYDNFEGSKAIRYTERTGVFDSIAKNPKPDSVNKSSKCGLYIRNKSKKFDNIKMELPLNLTDVNQYATYLGTPPKLKMKIFTNAPVGTLVEILLGNRNGNNDYPAGTNSQYQTYTTKTNAWEELEFKFSQVPQGSQTSFSQINQITLLFNPNSSTSDTYYFDEITGPPMAAAENAELMVTPGPNSKKTGTDKKTEPGKKTEQVKKVNTTKKIAEK